MDTSDLTVHIVKRTLLTLYAIIYTGLLIYYVKYKKVTFDKF